MLKYQNAWSGLKKRICTHINLAKSTKNFSRARNLSKIAYKLPLIPKPQIESFGSVFSRLCNISSREAITQENGDITGTFEIGPLEMGQGVTLGSTLRRAILGALTGSAVTGFKINETLHEFSIVSNIKEDMFDIASNLKGLRLTCGAINGAILGQIWATGPQIITGGMLQFPKDTVTVLNPSHYICTITTGIARLDVEVSSAAAYEKILERRKAENLNAILLHVDAHFTPIRNVSYKVKLGHDIYGTLSDIVEFTVTTTGAYSPRRAILEGAKEIIELFCPLILEPRLVAAIAGKTKS